ncbi:hypothetical protein BC008_36150 [Mastigocoleus testarum BC008]|uniref:Uncharacterized protein n=1 Tax=Mastigocoleus testarum BC008 TaxID=371196 RepID=A0A0V7ZZ08_9CYAN|nr:hypothetical protein BC008_30700 [Mastigocoleus testarum BC008]KST69796.1 hypothetical protein BC008_36150 [Mastigocoleus testarum BC008]
MRSVIRALRQGRFFNLSSTIFRSLWISALVNGILAWATPEKGKSITPHTPRIEIENILQNIFIWEP